MAEQNKEEKKSGLNPLTKIAVGAIAAFLIFKYTPVIEALQIFFSVVLIPVAFLAALGLMSQGAAQGISEKFGDKIQAMRDNLTDKVREKTAEYTRPKTEMN